MQVVCGCSHYGASTTGSISHFLFLESIVNIFNLKNMAPRQSKLVICTMSFRALTSFWVACNIKNKGSEANQSQISQEKPTASSGTTSWQLNGSWLPVLVNSDWFFNWFKFMAGFRTWGLSGWDPDWDTTKVHIFNKGNRELSLLTQV